ncbi:MAG: DUF4296 domain-containing protein [Bacteroidales bacterium]|nr:DUF4296 domain-containing protein [Bacteroidales bacterium]
MKNAFSRFAPILLFVGMLLFVSCRGRVRIPAGVMQPDSMVSFLADAYLLEGFYAIESNYQYQEVSPQLRVSYDSLLTRHRVTAEEFRRSLDFYVRHPDLNDSIHARAIRQLDNLQ